MTIAMPTTVMDRLKAETAQQHHDAERHQFQRDLATGRLPQPEYVRYLQQMLLVHRALEAKLAQSRNACAHVGAVIHVEQFQVEYLEADLRSLGHDPDELTPLCATQEFCRHVASLSPDADSLTLLGMHYVLEGSNNGSRFIARALAKQYGLTPENGLRYLDPYGDAQRDKWLAFRRDVDARGLSAAQADVMVAAAKEMFIWISRISDDLAGGKSACACAAAKTN